MSTPYPVPSASCRDRPGVYRVALNMPYDEDLANRIREQLVVEEGVTQKRMFGGITFLVHGNIAVSASGRGGLMLRMAPEDTDDALSRPHTELAEMRADS